MAKKVLVFSGKGGVGKSSVTVCLAKSLLRLGKKVLLIDADVGFRSLDLIMGIGVGIVFNWLDVIESNCKYENAVVSGDGNEPDLLTAPAQYSKNINFENMKNLVDFYDSKYDYIFIDAPAGTGELNDVFTKLCDSSLLIATPDLVSVRSASVASNKVYENNNNIEMRLIINRFNKEDVLCGRQMKVDDVIDSTAVQLIGVVPEDDSIRLLPVKNDILKYPRDAFDRIASRVIGENIPLREKDFY